MRILITSPDGIGDAVLRLPLLGEMVCAGHEVMVVCRGHARFLLERVGGGGVEVLSFEENPYEFTRGGRVDFSVGMMERVKRFRPEVLVFGPYQWTIVEEHLARVLEGVRVVRMNGYRFEHETNSGVSWIGEGRTEVVAVGEYWHESLKNQALAEAVLGRAVVLGDPKIVVRAEDVERGQRRLGEVFGGEVAGEFWFGCMGSAGDYYGELKDWGRENWCAVLRHVVRERGMRFVLVGNNAERASLESLRGESGVAEKIRVVTGDIAQSAAFSELLGLAALSQGYLGRDTGPMHIAGAVGRAVVAVFGGGMWPRFLPMATPSWAGAVDLPCAPCKWVCRHPESWCVKRVPVGAVVEALDTVICGGNLGRVAKLIAPSQDLYEMAKR